MPWIYPPQSLSSAESLVSGTTLAITTGVLAPVGGCIIVSTAWDNTDTADGETTRLSCTDSAGNTYTKAVEFTNGQGAAAAGATVAVFFTDVTVDLPVGGTITVTCDTARTVKVAAARWFDKTVRTNTTTAISYQTNAGDAADPASMTISGLPSREYLFFHAVGLEGLTTDVITYSTNYTSTNGDGTNNGGAADTNMNVRSEWRVLNWTGDSVDMGVSVARDYAQVFIAFREENVAAATPIASVIRSNQRW